MQNTWSFWRIQAHAGVEYTAAYEDGDKSVALFSSTDGLHWDRGADIYTVPYGNRMGGNATALATVPKS